MTRGRSRLAARLTIVLVMVAVSVGSASLTSAQPTQEEVRRAEERLDALNRELSLLVEQYNQAQIRLQQVEERLAEVRTAAQQAEDDAAKATASLNRRAARAYTGIGSQFAVLFDATSISDFTDRMEFLGSMAQQDADLATAAELARQKAQWTAEELAATADERRDAVAEIDAKRDQIQARVADARALYEELDREYHEALAAARAAAQAAAQQPSSGGTPGGSTGGSPIPPPPAPNGNVQAVLDAAYSVIGTPYQWGGSSPETGFDCSGFTMWSWAHAGVSLPHSSAAQYAALPHVARSDLQPGDLLFFYSPISHVAMYVGGDRMIHSSHPGTTVGVVAVYWEHFVGAARPG
ncbi:MAG TPA: NlpC/P60 family protein [Actinomycetota bacterium]|nr:NlpC/P60 family protein [Actinomycetota bacterium]